jgi:hypothetical protein
MLTAFVEQKRSYGCTLWPMPIASVVNALPEGIVGIEDLQYSSSILYFKRNFVKSPLLFSSQHKRKK